MTEVGARAGVVSEGEGVCVAVYKAEMAAETVFEIEAVFEDQPVFDVAVGFATEVVFVIVAEERVVF